MNAKDFFFLVDRMRSKQRSYKSSKDINELVDCEALEKQVDDEIFRVNRILELQATAEAAKNYLDS